MRFEPGSIVKRRLTGWYTAFSWIVGIEWHMGVYVGDGMVIHLNSEKKSVGARVCKVTLREFAAGESVVLHAAPRNPSHARAVGSEATRQLECAQNGFNDNYCFAWNNCEDFCVACYQVHYG